MGRMVPNVVRDYQPDANRDELKTLRELAAGLGAEFTVYHGIHWTRERQSGCGFGEIDSNSLESSTVDMATELTDMISAQSAYEANSKVVKAADDMLQQVNSIVR